MIDKNPKPIKKPYSNLSQERADALELLIKRIQTSGELNFESGNDDTNKFRAKAKEKFTFALV